MIFRQRTTTAAIVTVVLTLVVSIFLINHAWAHGSLQEPISRAYNCFLEGPESPTSAACQAALAVGGPQQFYDWNEINLLAYGQHQSLIPDGQLCSAGKEKYAGLDLARSDWPAQNIARDTNGNFEFVYRATAPHSTLYFQFYVTKDGYDPMQPLKWSDLEDTPFCTITDVTLTDGTYRMTCALPAGKNGRHVIYNIWQRDDSPEAFYACSDVIFGEDNTTPMPTATPDPNSCTALTWHAASVFFAGTVVSHNNHEWQAKWWTQGEEPGTTGQWGVWEDLGPCNGTPIPTSTNTPIATNTPPATNTPVPASTNTPIPTNTPLPTTTHTPLPPTPTLAPPTPTPDSNIPPWTPDTFYNVGDQVIYNGTIYQCLQAHTALSVWTPPAVPALWQPQN